MMALGTVLPFKESFLENLDFLFLFLLVFLFIGILYTLIVSLNYSLRNFKIFRLERFIAIVNNPTKYFKYHQLGGRKLPKRVMIAINRKMTKKIINIFKKYLKVLLR